MRKAPVYHTEKEQEAEAAFRGSSAEAEAAFVQSSSQKAPPTTQLKYHRYTEESSKVV